MNEPSGTLLGGARRRLLGAGGVARSDHDRDAGAAQPQRQPEAERPGSTDDADRARHRTCSLWTDVRSYSSGAVRARLLVISLLAIALAAAPLAGATTSPPQPLTVQSSSLTQAGQQLAWTLS